MADRKIRLPMQLPELFYPFAKTVEIVSLSSSSFIFLHVSPLVDAHVYLKGTKRFSRCTSVICLPVAVAVAAGRSENGN